MPDNSNIYLSYKRERINFNIIKWGLFFVVIIYDYVQTYIGFKFIDELFCFFMLLFGLINQVNKSWIREYLFCLAIFIFYLLYSLAITTNCKAAIYQDFVIQLKPYIIFYSTVLSGICVSTDLYKQKLQRFLRNLAAIMIPLGILSNTNIAILATDAGGARFCSAMTIISLLYIYVSKRGEKDIKVGLLILSIGFLPFKAKFIAIFATYIILFYFFGKKRIKINPKYIFLAIISLAIIFFLIKDKFYFYFVAGSQADNIFARPALFMGAFEIIKDYVPFGSGFGSFATAASADYFSPIYLKYDVLRYSELSEGEFLTDTFFPALAEFGILGIFLFLIFWFKRIKQINLYFNTVRNIIGYKSMILIVVFFLVESFADSTYTQNRGIFMFLVLGLFLNELKKYNFKTLHFNKNSNEKDCIY